MVCEKSKSIKNLHIIATKNLLNHILEYSQEQGKIIIKKA